ncbi:MAG: AraC family transcriptional regulator [Verrucomicrobiota bacterium]|nr:AraC family transcriptional regulator [Verrucomicrobiota bacterium]
MPPLAKQPETFFRYPPASPIDAMWGLVPTTAGFVKIKPGMGYPPPGHPKGYQFSWKNGRVLDEYQLHYIPRGRGILESEASGKKDVEIGDFFLLFPGMRHRYCPDDKTGWDEYWVGFKGKLANDLFTRRLFTPDQPVIRVPLEERAHELFSEILTQLRTESAGFMCMISTMITQLLAQIHATSLAEKTESRVDRVIRQARFALRERLAESIDMQKLAQELGVSYSWLRRNFRCVTGLAPHQYLLQLRLGHAMDILSASLDCMVKDAALNSGFDDELYFSRIFKKRTGLSPKAWQSRRRNAADI